MTNASQPRVGLRLALEIALRVALPPLGQLVWRPTSRWLQSLPPHRSFGNIGVETRFQNRTPDKKALIPPNCTHEKGLSPVII